VAAITCCGAANRPDDSDVAATLDWSHACYAARGVVFRELQRLPRLDSRAAEAVCPRRGSKCPGAELIGRLVANAG